MLMLIIDNEIRCCRTQQFSYLSSELFSVNHCYSRHETCMQYWKSINHLVYSQHRPIFAVIGSSPGDAPVGLDLQDGGIVGVVELHLRVPQLGGVDVHHDRRGSWRESGRGHTHDLLRSPPGGAGGERKMLHTELHERTVCAPRTTTVSS